MSYLLVLLGGIAAWLQPVVGYGLFMLLQTPLSNVAGSYAHEHLSSVMLLLATVRVLVRKSRQPGLQRLDWTELCALALSVVVLIRESVLQTDSYAPGALLRILVLASLWGPLLVAVNRLDEQEMSRLRLWMAMAGIVVGCWGALIYLTANTDLMRMAIWANPYSEEARRQLSSSAVEAIVKNRFVVMGLFTVVPGAYWYVLRGALAHANQHLIWNLVMWVGAGTVLLTAAISVTRSTLLLLALGTFVLLLLHSVTLLRADGVSRRRGLTMAVTALLFFSFVAYKVDTTVLVEQIYVRFSTLGVDDPNVVSRRTSTANAWSFLSENICFFGAPGPDPRANFDSGDTALIPDLWLWYGVPGVLLYLALYFGAFARLPSIWSVGGLGVEFQLLRSMLVAWAPTYVYAIIVGYAIRLPPVVFFTVLFFCETGRLRAVLPQPGMDFSSFWVNNNLNGAKREHEDS